MLPNAPAPERSGLTSAPLVGSEEQPTHATPRWMNRGDATRPGARGPPQRRDQMDEHPRAEDEGPARAPPRAPRRDELQGVRGREPDGPPHPRAASARSVGGPRGGR